MALQTDVCEQLRELDQVLASHDPTVQDAFKQAVVLSKVAELNPATQQPGPLEKMFWELTELRREVEMLKFNRYQEKPSDYWSPNTYERGRNYGNWGITTDNTGGLPSLTIEDINNLSDSYYTNPITTPNDRTVMPASPTDLDAFTMFDPDTGDSMSVKYK
jgi:hypothetical protein